MDGYRPRVVDHELDELLAELPALAIDGAKGVGKTVTASRRAREVVRLDDPAQLDLMRADPRLLQRLAGTVLVDEWQRYPPIWDFVRREVDGGAVAGRYL